jgi:hypothetical protein
MMGINTRVQVTSDRHLVKEKPPPEQGVVNPRGTGRRQKGRGAGEGRPWRQSDVSASCSTGMTLGECASTANPLHASPFSAQRLPNQLTAAWPGLAWPSRVATAVKCGGGKCV